MEGFIQDPQGPILGLSNKYVLNLTDDQIDFLGGEVESVVDDRNDTERKIERLKAALKIASEVGRKSKQLEE